VLLVGREPGRDDERDLMMKKTHLVFAAASLPILATIACGQAKPSEQAVYSESAMTTDAAAPPVKELTPEEKKQRELWEELWGETGGEAIADFLGFLKNGGVAKNFVYIMVGAKIKGNAEIYLNGKLFTTDEKVNAKLKEIFNVRFTGGATFEGAMWVAEWKDSIVITPELKKELEKMKADNEARLAILKSDKYKDVDKSLKAKFRFSIVGINSQINALLGQRTEGVTADGAVVAFGGGELSAKLLFLALEGQAEAWAVFLGGGTSATMTVEKFLEMIRSFTPAAILGGTKMGAITPTSPSPTNTAVASATPPPPPVTTLEVAPRTDDVFVTVTTDDIADGGAQGL
jgi:hypothetical protein